MYNLSDWANLSKSEKNQINQLADTLDDYNNGLIGPPPCSENDNQKELIIHPFIITKKITAESEKDKGKSQENTKDSSNYIIININIQNSSNFRVYLNTNKEVTKE